MLLEQMSQLTSVSQSMLKQGKGNPNILGKICITWLILEAIYIVMYVLFPLYLFHQWNIYSELKQHI